MKTEELAQHLQPMRPCASGLHRLLRHDTVAQWWRSCNEGQDLCFLWLFVAIADEDDVFARDLAELEPDDYILTWIRKFREGVAYPAPCEISSDQAEDPDFIRRTFRRPTDQEIRTASKWWSER